MRRVPLIIALLVILSLAPLAIASGSDQINDPGLTNRDTRAGQSLNFTYLNHDAANFGSTAFRVWNEDLVIFAEAFPNETACIWNPESIMRADIILQAPHGHMSHYDPDEVACVARNTGAYVVGNNALHNDMISRGVDSNKVIELNPAMGGKVTKTITDLNVKITSYGMEHTWMSGVQDNTFLVEMPSGIKWYHGTCSSGATTESYMAGAPELKGLDVMILDFDLIKPSIYNNFYPDLVIKDHDYQTFQATVYNYKQQNIGTLSHNQTFQYAKPDHPPEVIGMEFSPLEGDMNTNFTFTATYKYWYDRPAVRAELFLDGTAIPLTTVATSGFRTGVQYSKVLKMSPGDRSYSLEFEVDGRTTRVPETGEVLFHVNHIPELTGSGYDPQEGDTDSTYRFMVTYTDPENKTPTRSYIFIDGDSHSMKPGSLDYASGVEFSYSSKLTLGDHYYHMVFSDGLSEVRYPSSGEETLQVARANYPPVLSQGGVDDMIGARKDTFTFSVRYKDNHGDAPTKRLVLIDDVPFNMTMVGNDIKRGVEFRYSTGLGLGNHTFHFEFNDGRFEVRLPEAEVSEFVGPSISNIPPIVEVLSPSPNSEHSDLSPISFNASGTFDGDGDVLNIEWSSDLDGKLGTGMAISRLLSAGTHVITLSVDDGYGGSVSTNLSIVVVHYETRLIPELAMTPTGPKEGETVNVMYKVTNAGNLKGENITVSLLLDDATLKSEFLTSLLPLAHKSYIASFKATPGGHQLLLRVSNLEDIKMVFDVPVRPPPVAEAGADLSVSIGETLTFDASGSSSSGQLVHYLWDFDDGSNSSGRVVEHAFLSSGRFNVTLTVTDDLGKKGADTLVVTVTEVELDDDGPQVDEESTAPFIIIVALVVLVLLVLAVIAMLLLIRRRKDVAITSQKSDVAVPSSQPGMTPGGPQSQGQTADISFLFVPRPDQTTTATLVQAPPQTPPPPQTTPIQDPNGVPYAPLPVASQVLDPVRPIDPPPVPERQG